jgi:hypothetical protein
VIAPKSSGACIKPQLFAQQAFRLAGPASGVKGTCRMGQAITERRIMGVWVFELADPEAARTLYADLPAPLKASTELRVCMGSGHLHAASDDAAAWLRQKMAA